MSADRSAKQQRIEELRQKLGGRTGEINEFLWNRIEGVWAQIKEFFSKILAFFGLETRPWRKVLQFQGALLAIGRYEEKNNVDPKTTLSSLTFEQAKQKCTDLKLRAEFKQALTDVYSSQQVVQDEMRRLGVPLTGDLAKKMGVVNGKQGDITQILQAGESILKALGGKAGSIGGAVEGVVSSLLPFIQNSNDPMKLAQSHIGANKSEDPVVAVVQSAAQVAGLLQAVSVVVPQAAVVTPAVSTALSVLSTVATAYGASQVQGVGTKSLGISLQDLAKDTLSKITGNTNGIDSIEKAVSTVKDALANLVPTLSPELAKLDNGAGIVDQLSQLVNLRSDAISSVLSLDNVKSVVSNISSALSGGRSAAGAA